MAIYVLSYSDECFDNLSSKEVDINNVMDGYFPPRDMLANLEDIEEVENAISALEKYISSIDIVDDY